MMYKKYVTGWALTAGLVVLAGGVTGTAGQGIGSARVCLTFPVLLMLTLLPAEAVVTVLSEKAGLRDR